MSAFKEYLENIENPEHRQRVKEIVDWIADQYPFLDKRIAWNQPNFVHDGTFILGLSYAKAHVAIAPEQVAVAKFRQTASANGYSTTDQLIRIRWNQPVDYVMLRELIDFNIKDKKGNKTYWRHP